MKNKGNLIAIEGIEGTGKSTLSHHLAEYLKPQGAILTREPGGSELAEDIRAILKSNQYDIDAKTECLLMFASRSLHLSKLIKPALEEGKIVICDRYVDASYAYQGGGRGVSSGAISALDQWVCGDIQPDISILLVCDPEIAMNRVYSRSAEIDRFEKEDLVFFKRTQDAYMQKIATRPNHIMIDASQAKEDVFAQAIAHIEKWL